MSVSNLSKKRDLLAWLFARQRFGIKPGLERTRALLDAIGNPQHHFESVLVGGTNGKGSTASTLASILSASGNCTALFTSPHLSTFAERFVVDGEQTAAIWDVLREIKPAVEESGATFFEATTALACLLFANANVKCAVMEVGLGGRFDATNVLDPSLSIITGVSRDHTHILGDTLGEIAFEKAGIMRPGRLCLTGARGEALKTLREQAQAKGATLWSFEAALTLGYQDLGLARFGDTGLESARSAQRLYPSAWRTSSTKCGTGSCGGARIWH